MNRTLWSFLRPWLITEVEHEGLEAEPATSLGHYDNFYTPANEEFYSKISYLGLDPLRKEIRLLRFSRHEPGKPTQCELVDKVVHEEVKGQYKALSYCAGDPKRTQIIFVNNIPFNVFANLGHALDEVLCIWQTSHPEETLLLWIDQICINQSSPEERSHQVGFMKDIYESSMETIVCLSVEESDGAGIEWLRQCSNDIESTTKRYSREVWLAYLRRNLEEQEFNTGLSGFFEVLRSPWWTRAWVFQEFLMSPRLQLLFGRCSISWYQCSRALFHLLDTLDSLHPPWEFRIDYVQPTMDLRGKLPRSPVSKLTEMSLVEQLHSTLHSEKLDGYLQRAMFMTRSKIFQSSDTKPLRDILGHSRQCKSSDPRDRVYAFLGSLSADYSIVPDYSSLATVTSVFTKTACRIILQERNLMVLHDSLRSSKDHTVPSWVPDWTCPISPSFFTDIWQKYSSSTSNQPLDPEIFSVNFRNGDNGENDSILEAMGYRVTIWDQARAESTYLLKWEKSWISKINDDFVVFTAEALQIGDELWVIPGTVAPLIFRQQFHHHSLIGEALILKASYNAMRIILISERMERLNSTLQWVPQKDLVLAVTKNKKMTRLSVC
jgi:hypothetical protein